MPPYPCPRHCPPLTASGERTIARRNAGASVGVAETRALLQEAAQLAAELGMKVKLDHNRDI